MHLRRDFVLLGISHIFLEQLFFLIQIVTIYFYCHARGHPFSAYAKFSEKLTFLTP